MHVWETVQLHTLTMDARELKRQYGRHIAFFGGVNTQRLPFASSAEVEPARTSRMPSTGRVARPASRSISR